MISVIFAILLGSNSTLKPNKHSDMLLSMFSESVKKIFQTTTKLYGLPIELYYRFNLKGWRDFKDSVDTSLFLGWYLQVTKHFNFQKFKFLSNYYIILF